MNIQVMFQRGISLGLIREEGNRIFYEGIGKDYQNDPEEYVRAAAYVYLIDTLKYSPDTIDTEVMPLQRNPQNPSDLVVYTDEEKNTAFLVSEFKAGSSMEEVETAKRQGLGNANLQSAQFLLCVCDSDEFAYDLSSPVALRNIEKARISQIPESYGVAPVFRYLKGDPNLDLSLANTGELMNKFERSHKTLWEGGKRDPVTAFDEMSKIMFAKIHDEMHTQTSAPYLCQIGSGETLEAIAGRIKSRYEEARSHQPGLGLEEITVDDSILVEVVGNIQDVSLSASDIDAKGRAFEYFVGEYFRGKYGQYFTPRNIVTSIVKITNLVEPIIPTSVCIDPACGSGGFLLETLTLIRESVESDYRGDEKAIQRLNWDFAANKLFGVEINEKIARVAMMDMVIHDDGHSNIKCHDALDDFGSIDESGIIDEGKFDFVTTNPPFGDSVGNSKHYYANFQLGGSGEIAAGETQQIEILFIERCFELLKEGGILSIVLPDSAFTNLEFIPVCDYALSQGRLIGVLSLPQFTFKPFGAEAKTSVYFFKKDTKEEGRRIGSRQAHLNEQEVLKNSSKHLSPKEYKKRKEAITKKYIKDDYPICYVHVEKVGYKPTGKVDDDLLPMAVEKFEEYLNDPGNFVAGEITDQIWWNKVSYLELITKLDAKAYDPKYFRALGALELLEEGEIVRLGDLCITEGIFTGSGSRKYLDAGVPIVKTADVVKRRRVSKHTRINAARLGLIKWEEISDHVPVEYWESQGNKQLLMNDILVQDVAHMPEYIGDKITLVDMMPESNQALALNKFLIIRSDPQKINPEYLVMYLASEFGRLQMARFNRGMTAQIYEVDVKDFLVYVPPEEIRNRLSDDYQKAITRLRSLESEYTALLDELDNFDVTAVGE